jgi:type I restriction enzyme S subunit
MIEWKSYKIKEIGKVITGNTPSSKSPEHWGDELAFITPTDFDSYNKSIFDSIRKLSSSGIKSLERRLLPKNSIVVTCIGSQMGKVAVNKIDCITNQQINSIIPFPNFDYHFLYYAISSKKDFLRNLATGGSTMPIVNKTDFENIELEFPPLPTQKAIAEILSSLDDKIELNNQINQNLEALAQALFKQWFVDFEFLNENGEPYKSSGGEMVDSELGEIPKGWEVKSLDEIANYLNGLALQKFRPKSESEPSLPVIKIKELRQGYSGGEEKASIEIDKKYIILDGDILFSWSGSLLVDFWTGGKGALNQHLFKVSSQTYPKWFIFLWTKFHLLEFQKIAESKATTMGHIQRKHLSDAKVLVPSNSLLKKFTETFECIIEELISSRLESRKLMNLRDTLLPKLISGELEVSEASLEPTF